MKKKSNRNVVQRCSILFTGRNITVISIKCATPCLREILSMYWISFLFFNNKWLQTKHNWWTKNRRVEKDITTIAMYQLPSIVLQNVSTCTDNAAWKPDTFCSGKKNLSRQMDFLKFVSHSLRFWSSQSGHILTKWGWLHWFEKKVF